MFFNKEELKIAGGTLKQGPWGKGWLKKGLASLTGGEKRARKKKKRGDPHA